MYYRDENGKIIEGYDGNSSFTSGGIPVWAIILIVVLLLALIGVSIYVYRKNNNQRIPVY